MNDEKISPIFILVLLFFAVQIQAQNITATIEVYAPAQLIQNDFQFFSPTNLITPDDCWPPGFAYCLAENTNLTLAVFPIHQNGILRLRTSLAANDDMAANSFRFKLQFKSRGAGCEAGETWYDVGTPTSTAAWRGFDVPDLNDDVSLEGDPLLSGSDGIGYYNESGTSDWNTDPLYSGQIIEYDWSLQNNSADYGTTYCFRMVQVDADDQTIDLVGYARYIEIETPPQYLASSTQTVDFNTGDSFYLTNPDNTQFFIEAPIGYYTDSLDFKMYSFAKNDIITTIDEPTCCDTIGDYIYEIQSQKDNFFEQDFDQNLTLRFPYKDADVANYNESSLGVRRWDGAQWVTLSSTVDTANNVVTALTSAFSFFGIFGEQTVSPYCGDGSCNGSETCSSCSGDCGSCPPPPPSGGGGGGGGGITVQQTRVILRGKAYPKAKITILKDGQVEDIITADSQANFNVTFTQITPGIYTFGVWAEDGKGRRSITFSFTATVTKDMTTTIGSIFLPPTIELEKPGVKQGEILSILGQTAPESKVSLSIYSSEIIKKTTADGDGDWIFPLDTEILEDGSHTVRAKAETSGGLLSSFSKVLRFYVGEEILPGEIREVDMNTDNKVNLVDFSILLYNWGVPKNPAADLNSDGKVNLTDFSIMLYYWTG